MQLPAQAQLVVQQQHLLHPNSPHQVALSPTVCMVRTLILSASLLLRLENQNI